MSGKIKYCPICKNTQHKSKAVLKLICSHTICTIHEIQTCNMSKRQVTAKRTPIGIHAEEISYHIRCPRCGTLWPTTATLTDYDAIADEEEKHV